MPSYIESLDQIADWSVRYNGKGNPLDFVERIEELSEIYDIDLNIVPRMMTILLKDWAAMWYRNNNKRWTLWSSFKADFLEFFLPYDYYERLAELRTERVKTSRSQVQEAISHRLISKHSEATSLPNTTKCMPTTRTGQHVDYSVNLEPHGPQNKKSYQQQSSFKVKQTTIRINTIKTATTPLLSKSTMIPSMQRQSNLAQLSVTSQVNMQEPQPLHCSKLIKESPKVQPQQDVTRKEPQPVEESPQVLDAQPHSVPLQGKPQKEAIHKCIVTPPQISTSHRESPEVCYQQAYAQQSLVNYNQNTQPREQKHQLEEHDLSSRPALPQQLEPQPPSSVNQPQSPRGAPPRDNHQSGQPSSSSSTTSLQRNSTIIQPVSDNRHVQLTNSLGPLVINVSDSKLNTELPSQGTQAKGTIKHDSQQEPWSPQEKLNVIKPSTKGNKPEIFVQRLGTFKRKDDHPQLARVSAGYAESFLAPMMDKHLKIDYVVTGHALGYFINVLLWNAKWNSTAKALKWILINMR
ncbi:transcriptional regulator DEF1-like [Teleopsis dalmanni]|uniref:transcriptional regulator DEF1-like n=1 Tax=Teleopsis dalmanni TaxID=139649 RepID=UPI0018CCCA2E|nr:transcriptional regulator DEF1-like [Teleopsis dalmanni]